jgi:uncharacterized protein
MSISVKDRVLSKGPKKILTLDGGGIRGLITVEVLIKIERLLRDRAGPGSQMVLADYFDFVAGTSTGAIIAAGIALGMPAEKIRDFYLDSGKEMFDRANILKRLRYKFEDDKLANQLKTVFGADTLLGSDKLRCVLMMVTRNVSTDSPWPISNNPFALYNATTRDDCNLKLPLWQLVRASTAAPTYFPPEVVAVGARKFVFVDGGVTPYNNPAFLAFLMATSQPYKMGWQTGESDMLVISIGTGSSANANVNLDPDRMHLLYNATSIPGALMYGALNEQDMLCRVFGKCLAGDSIDREFKDGIGTDPVSELIGTLGPVNPKLFTYARYNVDLTYEGLEAIGVEGVDPERIQLLDSVQYMDDLQKVGAALAEKRVTREHFAAFA